jgi:hypothetical protein
MLIPDVKRLRTYAAGIAEQRRHSLCKPTRDDDGFGTTPAEADGRREAPYAALTEDRQCSLFAAISSVALDEQGRPMENPRVVEEDDEAGEGDVIPDLVDMSQLNAPLAHAHLFEGIPWHHPVPLPDPEPVTAPASTSALARRRRLRELNSDAVRDVVHATGKTHPQVNAILNKRVGIKRITEASVRQLERRLELAKALLHAPKAGRTYS